MVANETGALLLHAIFYMTSTKVFPGLSVNLTFLEEPVDNPFFESKCDPITIT